MRTNTNSRGYKAPTTGLKVRFDPAEPGQPGRSGKDYYHIENPLSTGKGDRYLDINRFPVPKGSNPSHIPPKGAS